MVWIKLPRLHNVGGHESGNPLKKYRMRKVFVVPLGPDSFLLTEGNILYPFYEVWGQK